jgi:hypothetical protein
MNPEDLKFMCDPFPDPADCGRCLPPAESSHVGAGTEENSIAPDGKLMGVPVTVESGTVQSGTPVALFQTRIAFGATVNRQQYDVAPDGRFLINQTAGDATAAPITILQNWKPPK